MVYLGRLAAFKEFKVRRLERKSRTVLGTYVSCPVKGYMGDKSGIYRDI